MACAENQNDVANNRFRWVTFYSYDEAGQANQTTDPMGYMTQTSYNNATPGSGTALNQCALAYNTFGQLTAEEQDHNGTASSSSPKVQYFYDMGASGSNEIRFKDLSYPNGRTIASSYGVTGGMNDLLNRVDTIQDASGPTNLASYTYVGLGAVVRITYPQPSVWLDLWGGTSGTFNGLDLFNRVIDQRWQNGITGTPTDVDRYQYGYDQDSNRLYKANVVGTPIVTGGLDEYYDYDHLNRLVEMQRGTLNSGKTGITGTPSIEQTWSLDPAGNWSGFVTRASGTTNLNQSRTSNTVNEITAITESTGPTWIVPAYDAAGNATTMPQVVDPTQSFTAVYDAWNRMVRLAASGATVGGYRHDGRNRRIVVLTYASGVLSETRHFYFTNEWQDVEERVGTSTSMDKQYMWGMRYVDELVCRDDATPARLYACQDANFNLTCITDATGNVHERYLFSPYGDRIVMDASWDVIASSAYQWSVAHQGLTQDIESNLVYNRKRMMHSKLGYFLRRDDTYRDGPSLHSYVGSNPCVRRDPTGRGFVSDLWGVIFGNPYAGPSKPMPNPHEGESDLLPPTKDRQNCMIRVRYWQGAQFHIPHAGLYVYNGGTATSVDHGKAVVQTAALDGTGTNQGATNAKMWLHDANDGWNLGDPNYGDWTQLDQGACNCLLNQNNADNISSANTVPYNGVTTNSNWMLRCYLKMCNIDVALWQPGFTPWGWNSSTPCPTCNKQ